MAKKDEVGRRGEDCACDYLLAHGYRLLDRNWRCVLGEIDLIVEKRGIVVFVEVKSRSGLGFGHPFEAITPKKLARLRRLAAVWSAQADPRPRRIRIDAVAVLAVPGEVPLVEHLEDVF